MVTGGWLEFDSSPETTALQGGMTGHLVVVQDLVVSSFFQPFLPNIIPQILQKCNIKSIPCSFLQDTLMVLHIQVF
jgi:hypothetical protein